MTKEDFIDWKQHPVTKKVFLAIDERISELKDRLVSEAVSEADLAKQTAGAIQAFQFLLNIDMEDANGY